MLEFRYRNEKWIAKIDRLGLKFVIKCVDRREKEAYLLDVSEHGTGRFSNVYKTYERATIKANALYKQYLSSEEEE